MNPDFNQIPQNPQLSHVPQPKKAGKRTKLAIWLMAGPTALIILSFIGFAAINFAAASSNQVSSDTCATTQRNEKSSSLFSNENSDVVTCPLFPEPTPLETAGNVGFFIITGIAILAWLPGLITGIILLATKPVLPTQQL